MDGVHLLNAGSQITADALRLVPTGRHLTFSSIVAMHDCFLYLLRSVSTGQVAAVKVIGIARKSFRAAIVDG